MESDENRSQSLFKSFAVLYLLLFQYYSKGLARTYLADFECRMAIKIKETLAETIVNTSLIIPTYDATYISYISIQMEIGNAKILERVGLFLQKLNTDKTEAIVGSKFAAVSQTIAAEPMDSNMNKTSQSRLRAHFFFWLRKMLSRIVLMHAMKKALIPPRSK